MYQQSWWVLVLGLILLVAAVPVAGRRVWFLYRVITSGKPAPDRVEHVTRHLGETLKNQAVEVFGQKKLLKWSVPGAAHFLVFWAFVILGSVYLEAFGVLFSRNAAWHIPIIGRWDLLGFLQDFITVMCLIGIIAFAVIRLQNAPDKLGRKSRFSGSHLGGAWLVLFMILNVLWTLVLFRSAGAAEGSLPYGNGAFLSHLVGHLFGGLGEGALKALVGVGLLLHIGVMLAFLVIVLNSKHLHIFVAPLNVAFGRHPVALGAVKPLTGADGLPVSLDDIEEMDEDTTLGIGSISDFSWKGMLDFSSCTECGRCQSQCPAWNTEKPLSPKMLIMNLRDHMLETAPALLNGADTSHYSDALKAEIARPLVGATEGDPTQPSGGAVIDTDVLWSCVTCGACVEQCPVDIEHVDHIVDMRRYQVLVESNFPAELNQLFKGMENKGNPWNMSPNARLEWTQGLDFDVKVVGAPADEGGVESLDEVEWLFWVGCAGAYEDRAKKTTRAVAELLHIAEVDFAVLGNGETCTGDQARRAGNEFVFQGLAAQNVETFKEHKVKKVVSTCAHCFNTLKNEYSEFGIELEVVHHTQLLNRLVREGRLTPVKDGAGAHKRSITYHDPCYIGRHNGVYTPPRELLQVLPGADFVEMERNSERSFCCGAGGARMWMEENLGSRINMNRTNEAIGTGADQIAVGCPFCRVMLSDGLTAAQDSGDAREEVEVLDVAQMLLAAVKGEQATKLAPGAGAETRAQSEETKAEPEPGDDTQTADPENTVTDTADGGPAAKASGGTSLFDTPAEAEAEDDQSETADTEKSPQEEAKAAKPASAGGSLFDLGDDDSDDDADEPAAAAEAEAATAEPASDLGSGGSLFDVEAEEPAPAPQTETAETEPAAEAEAEAEPESVPEAEAEPKSAADGPAPVVDLGSGGSLFDIQADEPAAPKAEPESEAEPEPEPEAEPESEAEAKAETEAEPAVEPEPEPKSDTQPEAASEPEPASEPVETAKPTVDLAAGGSLFDIAAPEPIVRQASAPADAPATATATKDESSSSGSMFDVAAVDATDAQDAPSQDAPAAEPAPESDVESDAEPEAEAEVATDQHDAAAEPEPKLTGGAAVSQATFAGSDDPEPTAKAEPEPEPDVKPAPESKSEPEPEPDKPKSSGATHTPKTDVDITESSSLFDL